MSMTAEEFRDRRHELGMTQAELAEALGLSIRAVQYYEECGGKRVKGVPVLVEREMRRLKSNRKQRMKALLSIMEGA